MIRPEQLIEKFRYTVENKWGYIWGTAGELWTQAKQDAATREQTKEYGAKWIGHYVADCSGLFSWAFKQLGGYMYHGSNTMWNQHCTAKGNLKGGKRTDGEELKPGTAVFTDHDGNKTHVGLYTGNGEVIEASGTQTGVIISKVSNIKWKCWGELKGVSYRKEVVPVPEGYAVVNAARVALRNGPTTNATVIARANDGETVKIENPPDDWEYVEYKGKKGYMMKKFLEEGETVG